MYCFFQVKLYLTHWWRCNGPCQSRKPYFGVVRRNVNRAPGPSDYWWSTHQKTCGGTFLKIKEPEKKTKKATVEKKKKNMGDITKYVNNNNNKAINNNKAGDVRKPLTPLVKNNTNTPATKMKSVTNSPVCKPAISKPPLVFVGKGKTVDGGKKITNTNNVAEAVRNIWANKQLPTLANSKPVWSPKEKILASSSIAATNHKPELLESPRPNKHKADPVQAGMPPTKMKKIDDYFAATSILKDVYGEDYKLTQSNNKIVAKKLNLVDCPVCSVKIDSNEINRHLDECLNKDVIEKLSKDNIEVIGTQTASTSSSQPVKKESLKDIVGPIPPIPPFKMFKEENGDVKPKVTATIDLTNINVNNNCQPKGRISPANNTTNNFDQNDINRVKAVVKKITYDKHIRKSDNFVVPKEEPNNVDCGFLPSFLDDIGCAIKVPAVKIEPGTSSDIVSALTEQKCPCCSNVIKKPLAEHLDECLAFFNNNTTVPEEGASTSFANDTIVIDDDEDDIFDETQTFNATGTKTPCPCCLEMVESADMNNHLDICLS